MERSLELYSDGRLFEIEGDYAVKVTATQGQVDAIITALKFSTAQTLTVAPLGKQPPDVIATKGSRRINDEGFKLLTTFEGCRLDAYPLYLRGVADRYPLYLRGVADRYPSGWLKP